MPSGLACGAGVSRCTGRTFEVKTSFVFAPDAMSLAMIIKEEPMYKPEANQRVLTSTVEMGRPTIVIETPQIPSQVAKTDFLQTLRKVSRKMDSPIGENVRSTVKALKRRSTIRGL